MSSNKLFMKYCLQDNHWVGHLVTKYADTLEFQKRKDMIQGDNECSENFEMEILVERTLDKALMVTEN